MNVAVGVTVNPVARSAVRGFTRLSTVAVLLTRSGSACSEAMVADEEIRPGVPGATTIWIVALPPDTNLPRLQVTTPPACDAAPCDGVAETKETVDGSK